MGERVVGIEVDTPAPPEEGVIIACVIIPATLVAVDPRVVMVVDRRDPLDLNKVDRAGEDQPSRGGARAAGEVYRIPDVVVGPDVRRPLRLLMDKAEDRRPPRIACVER